MKAMKVFALLIAFSAQSALAVCSQQWNKIGLVGLDSTNGNVYVGVTEHNNNCNCDGVRFKEVNADTDKALSVLLSAKMSEKKVRIDFLDANDCDSAHRVYIQ